MHPLTCTRCHELTRWYASSASARRVLSAEDVKAPLMTRREGGSRFGRKADCRIVSAPGTCERESLPRQFIALKKSVVEGDLHYLGFTMCLAFLA